MSQENVEIVRKPLRARERSSGTLRWVPPTKIGSRITGRPRSAAVDLDPDLRLFEPQRAGVAPGRCPGT
jgi:hypothetical protein